MEPDPTADIWVSANGTKVQSACSPGALGLYEPWLSEVLEVEGPC